MNKVYKKARIRFRDITTIMNFYASHIFLAGKIAKEGKKGSVFIFHGPERRDTEFSPLNFEREIALRGYYSVDRALFIYRK